MFTVHQIRFGLATNSSSTHSLILIPGGAKGSETNGESFGWEFFTCATRESKLRYAATQLHSVMHRIASHDVAMAVAEAWAAKPGEYVDHQSVWDLPFDWKEQSPDREFFEELKAFLLREDVVVLGGNDNTEQDHPLAAGGGSFYLPIPTDRLSKLVCRKDDGGYWVLFNRVTGAKIRMSFDDASAVEPEKASAPELVDIKITDFCPYDCEFCYQGSTNKGEHADFSFLTQLMGALGELKVFEVAIGGGEPTLHPKFLEILQYFRYWGIVPNFTTKSLGWLKDHKLRPQILSAAGAFAYSIETAEDLKKLASLRDEFGVPEEQINTQYVMGSTSLAEFEEILRAAASLDVRVTLLGYKTNGRGAQFEPEDYSEWGNVLKKVRDEESGWNLRLGIDTALAAQSQETLDELEVPRWCYEVQEGKFSMYIDAVAQKTAKSSYGPSLAMKPLKSTYKYRLGDEIRRHFMQY